MTVTKTSALTPASYSLHRLLQDWGEGRESFGTQGNSATNGEATWRARFHPDVLWSVPGAAAPVDYVATASAMQSIAAEGSYTFDSTAGLVADVQSWLSNSATNFGWILICEDEASAATARRFGSREDPHCNPTRR